MSEPVESRVAGMWRPWPKFRPPKGTLVIFRDIPNDDLFDESDDEDWYNDAVEEGFASESQYQWLDESPEAIAEARQEKEIQDLKTFNRKCNDQVDYYVERNINQQKEIVSLTSQLAAVTKKKNEFLELLKEARPHFERPASILYEKIWKAIEGEKNERT